MRTKNTLSISKANGSRLKIGIVVSRWHDEITSSLLIGCKKALIKSGVKEKNIIVVSVPGSFELPFAAKHLIQTKTVSAVVCMGCLVKGQTSHYKYICQAVTSGIMQLNLQSSVPVIFGVLTCKTISQARVRSRGKNNHGYAWGISAVKMGTLKKK